MIEREDLTGERIFNCDEIGLNYRILFDRTLASREEKSALGHKKIKKRLTILLVVM